jgi:hypothetical protein
VAQDALVVQGSVLIRDVLVVIAAGGPGSKVAKSADFTVARRV